MKLTGAALAQNWQAQPPQREHCCPQWWMPALPSSMTQLQQWWCWRECRSGLVQWGRWALGQPLRWLQLALVQQRPSEQPELQGQRWLRAQERRRCARCRHQRVVQGQGSQRR